MFIRSISFSALAVVACLALPFGTATAQEGQTCGGILGTMCPEGQRCIDIPGDGCNPKAGGSDCLGTCSGDGGGTTSLQSTEEMAPPTCDYHQPDKYYVAKDLETCAVIRYACEEGYEPFVDDCGCGCQVIAQ